VSSLRVEVHGHDRNHAFRAASKGSGTRQPRPSFVAATGVSVQVLGDCDFTTVAVGLGEIGGAVSVSCETATIPAITASTAAAAVRPATAPYR
jgi:hypothetical protein